MWGHLSGDVTTLPLFFNRFAEHLEVMPRKPYYAVRIGRDGPQIYDNRREVPTNLSTLIIQG